MLTDPDLTVYETRILGLKGPFAVAVGVFRRGGSQELAPRRNATEDWPAKATSDAAQIAEWLSAGGRNYGIVCDEVAVIDADTPELALWWEENMRGTPWSVRTPRRGRHFFYRSVPGLRNAVKAHRGWDVRAGGNGYVVGFGSLVDGRAYELIGTPTLDLPPFDPAWLPAIREEPCLKPKTARRPRGRIRVTSQ